MFTSGTLPLSILQGSADLHTRHCAWPAPVFWLHVARGPGLIKRICSAVHAGGLSGPAAAAWLYGVAGYGAGRWCRVMDDDTGITRSQPDLLTLRP